MSTGPKVAPTSPIQVGEHPKENGQETQHLLPVLLPEPEGPRLMSGRLKSPLHHFPSPEKDCAYWGLTGGRGRRVGSSSFAKAQVSPATAATMKPAAPMSIPFMPASTCEVAVRSTAE
jgi:hypothetical protein